MTRTVRVHLIDDIDGSAADETVKFSLEEGFYEIDLSAEHSEQLRKSLAKYIVAGRRSSVRTSKVLPDRRLTELALTERTRNQVIREWARRAGVDVSERGRIPASIVERYERDHLK